MNKEVIQKMHFPKLFITTLFLGALSGAVFAGTIDSYFIEAEKDFEIALDTRNPEGQASFSFADYDIEAPAACKQTNVYCQEKMIIKAHIEKEWEVIPIPPIWDPLLTPQQFAKYYPDLSEDNIINDWSPSQDKWITQRILYERGILDVFPTGKIGFKTEEAITELQYYKGIEEVDITKGIVVIGPKTIRELNKLKARMEDPNFVSRSPLPNIPFEDMTAFHQKRLLQIDSELARREKFSGEEQLIPQLPIIKPENSGNQLQFSGEVKMTIVEE